jgi:DNA ligase-1
VERFAALVDALVYTRSRNEKLRLIAEYLKTTPDPDRGWALAALTEGLRFTAVKGGTIRTLMAERVDPVLWTLSRDFVGDTAETASLLWPQPKSGGMAPPTVSEAVDSLARMTRLSVTAELPRLLDRLDADGRYALIKLATGAMRVGVSARLAKTAFAQAFAVSVEEVEEYWHALAPPYRELFAWAADGALAPDTEAMPLFRPFMLAHALEDEVLDLADYVAEWKWDGIRVQVVHAGGETRLYSRTGDDVTASFPEMAGALTFPAVLDGELLVRGVHQGGEAGGRGELQRAAAAARPQERVKGDARRIPGVRAALRRAAARRRGLARAAVVERRARLEALMPRLPAERFDLSAVVEASISSTSPRSAPGRATRRSRG